MTDEASGTPPRQRREKLSSQELEFRRRWRLLIDRLGGQKHAAEKMAWSTSTVSRDYTGRTLPSNERLRELSNRHNLASGERAELEILLRAAREAREARREDGASQPEEEPMPSGNPPPAEPPQASTSSAARAHLRWIIPAAVAAAGVVVAGVVAGVLASSPGWRPKPTSAVSTQPAVKGSFPGGGVKTVSIPLESLSRPLRDQVHQDNPMLKTVTGFEFHTALNPAKCLTADDTGSLAGQERDPVATDTCESTPNQIWIPEQWETLGQPYTHLVSDKYQGMCLNVRKIGGAPVGPGSAVMLWKCYYPAGNESWFFPSWFQNVEAGHHSYPLFLANKSKERLCLDADSYPDVPAGIRLWTQQAAAGQFWF